LQSVDDFWKLEYAQDEIRHRGHGEQDKEQQGSPGGELLACDLAAPADGVDDDPDRQGERRKASPVLEPGEYQVGHILQLQRFAFERQSGKHKRL